MKTYLKILLLLAFVATQSVDIAFLDADEAAPSETHKAFGVDCEEPRTGHDIHSGCDIFHHLSPASSGKAAVMFGPSVRIWSSQSEISPGLEQGPPVPPPLA